MLETDDPTETLTGVDATLAFEADASVDLVPGETRELTIVTSPPDKYELYFALRDAPSDASLDANHLFAGEDGRATVRLHAPSTPSAFTLRAWIKDGPTTELNVTVSKQGVGSVEVIPQYDGKRAVNEWVASAIIGTTCDALVGQLPGEPEGALVATSPAQQSPVVQSVPVGPQIAVTVRAGHFAWGCTDTHDITAGGTTKVKIHVVDVPPALDRTSLDVTFSYAPAAAPYGLLLSSARDEFIDALLPPDKPESVTLLDAMAELSSDPAAFAAARDLGAWDVLAATHLAGLEAPIGSRVGEWIDLGLASSTAKLAGHLAAIEGVTGSALFFATDIGGTSADAAGAPLVHLMSWKSEPDDKVQLSGTVFWVPSRLVGAACKDGIALELGSVDYVSDAFAKVAACSDLASTLAAAQDPAAACDTACLTSLCRGALDGRWKVALDASAESSTVGTIDINATGMLKVDDVAMPVALAGSWLGTVSDGAVSAGVSGEFGGVLSEPDEPAPDEPSGDSPQ